MAKLNQFRLDFSHAEDFSREDFFVSESNKKALDLIEQWPDWQTHCLIVSGPKSSGKTHIATIWEYKSRARLFDPRDNWRDYKSRNVVVDDADKLGDEETILHLYNQAYEIGNFLLLTVTGQPEFKLKDLSSRLKASTIVEITQPDDELLKTLLVKLFSLRQMAVDAEVISYIVPRISRSFAAVEEFVALADDYSLEERRNLTIPLTREILAKVNNS